MPDLIGQSLGRYHILEQLGFISISTFSCQYIVMKQSCTGFYNLVYLLR